MNCPVDHATRFAGSHLADGINRLVPQENSLNGHLCSYEFLAKAVMQVTRNPPTFLVLRGDQATEFCVEPVDAIMINQGRLSASALTEGIGKKTSQLQIATPSV